MKTHNANLNWTSLACVGVLASCISTGCVFSRPSGNAAPVVFTAPPDVTQLVSAVNANSSRVKQLHSNNVRLSIPGQFGSVNATLDYDRPSRFRLSGESIRGRELDVGSNEREYWLWVKQNQPPTVFYGYQDQFYRSAAQTFLPMPPSWIVEALGVVYLDPGGDHKLYSSNTPGMLQVWSTMPTPRGNLLRVLEIDPPRALVVKQLVYGPNEELLASADASQFTHDILHNVSLPRNIQVHLPPAGLAFKLEVDSYTINAPPADPQSLFSMPQIPGHTYRDLANPADMQGIDLLGAAGATPDFYDNRAATYQRPETPRAAWRRFPPFNVLLR